MLLSTILFAVAQTHINSECEDEQYDEDRKIEIKCFACLDVFKRGSVILLTINLAIGQPDRPFSK